MANSNVSRLTLVLAMLGAIALAIGGYFLFFEFRVAAIIVDAIRALLITIVTII